MLHANSTVVLSGQAYKKRSLLNNEIKISPIYRNMFSSIAHYPSYSKTRILKNNNDELMGNRIIDRNFIRNYGSGCPQAYSEKSVSKLYPTPPQLTEKDRCFFMTNASYYNTVVLPNINKVNKLMRDGYFTEILVKSYEKTRSVYTQTIYRDSSSQTLPYTPDFLIRPGDKPEILTLIPLSYKVGLPPGLHEVMAFERARELRISEQKYDADQKKMCVDMAPQNNLNLIRKRLMSLSKKEITEWKIRDEELNEIQFARLKVIAQLLNQKREYYEKIHEAFLQRVTVEINKEKQVELARQQYNYAKHIRIILKRRLNLNMYQKKMSIIEQYGNYNSQKWAPLARIGQFLDQGSERYLLENKYLTTSKGLQELEMFIPHKTMFPNLTLPKLQVYTKSGFKKKKYRLEDELTGLYERFKQKRLDQYQSKLSSNTDVIILDKIAQVSPRKSISVLKPINMKKAKLNVPMILLQKLIRGRSCQVLMYESKEKRIDLILELRSTHSVDLAEMTLEIQKMRLMKKIRRNTILKKEKRRKLEASDYVTYGEYLSDISDFMSKELIRLQEERRLHGCLVKAMQERQKREAEESGLRQFEERRRREENEIFKQIIKTHQSTVDQYLDKLVEENVESTGVEISKKHIENMEEKIHEETYAKEANLDYLATEEIVSDLVHQFLIPEVLKKNYRDSIALKQRKYLLAAHREILKKTNEIMDQETSMDPPDEEDSNTDSH